MPCSRMRRRNSTVLHTRVWMRWLVRWPLARLARSLLRPGAVPRELLAAELVGAFVGLRRYQRARRLAAEASA